MMGFHDIGNTRVQNFYLRSKTTLLLHKSTQSVINSLIIFFKEGSSQLREWLRDCVRDCWQPVWKIFQLWWIGRLLISRWVFVVSRLNYPGLGLPWLSRSIGPITELGWEDSSNKITPFRHPTCIQKCEEKSFWTPPCKQSLVESTCTGLRVRHHFDQLMMFRSYLNWYVLVTHGIRTVNTLCCVLSSFT